MRYSQKNLKTHLANSTPLIFLTTCSRAQFDENIGERPAMVSIKSLILSHNPLSGSIPKSMGELSELQVLKLVGNGLSRKIPLELGNGEKLTTILFSRNRLRGSIPKEVLNLKNLREFDVSGNFLTGMIPPHKTTFPISAFLGNHGLCGALLPSCKKHL